MAPSPYGALEAVADPIVGGMLALSPPARTIQEVPALLVVLLNDSGKLPPIPNEPLSGVLGFRRPDIRDMQAVKWLASWDGARVDKDGFRKVTGLATYRDFYDHHTSSDVRELCAIRGSRRAVVELTRWLRDDAAASNRRLVGAIEKNDGALAGLMGRLGGKPVMRFMWEYGGEPCLS